MKKKTPHCNRTHYSDGIYTGYSDLWTTRRVIWQDVKSSLWNLLTITRDCLLIRSRSFSEKPNSVTFSTTSANGCTVKLVPSSVDSTTKAEWWIPAESTSTTSSGGSTTKRKVRRSSGTKKSHHHHTNGGYYLCAGGNCTGVGPLCSKRDL